LVTKLLSELRESAANPSELRETKDSLVEKVQTELRVSFMKCERLEARVRACFVLIKMKMSRPVRSKIPILSRLMSSKMQSRNRQLLLRGPPA
jgi:hypothetical protein